MKIPDRRELITEEVTGGDIAGPFAVTVGFVDGLPCEVFFTMRAKSGTALELLFYELGVTASKIMQGKPSGHFEDPPDILTEGLKK